MRRPAVLLAAAAICLSGGTGASAATGSGAVTTVTVTETTTVTATAAPTAAGAATTTADPNAAVAVTDLDAPQQGRRLTGRQVLAIAAKTPDAKRIVRTVKGAYAGAYTKGPGRWQVSYFSRDKPAKEVAQLYVDDASGRVTEHYTGFKVAWTMARGYAGAFGRKVNSPWVWIGFTLAFLIPFARVRGVRFDLVVVAAFGISVAFFNDAEIGTSVPIVYPGLAYLLGRMLWIGLRRRGGEGPARTPMRLLVPVSAMAIAVVFLMGFRIGLDVTTSNVIDVGYAGVIGADKLAAGEPIYGAFPKDNEHGDTYGPVAYAAYVPFLKAFGWSGRWDGDMPAAHAASITFDVICCFLMFLVGRRLRGPTLGVALAYLWAACPFTLYALMSNTNDALVSAFVLAALLVAGSPPARGVAVALGGLTKFATLALAPLFAAHGRERTRSRGVVVFCLAFGVVVAAIMVPVLLQGPGLSTIYERTLGFQSSRGSPFSVWGLYDLAAWQSVWQVLSVVLALTLAVVPRRRDVVGLAACAAAIVIALQLGVTHWFYLYIPWFFPALAVALFARYGEPGEDGPEPAASASPVAGEPSQETSTGSIAVA